MDWKTTLPTCFGSVDLALGSHDLDEMRAKTMIMEARGTGSTDDDIRNEVRRYLRSKSTTSDHISEQMQKLEEYLSDS